MESQIGWTCGLLLQRGFPLRSAARVRIGMGGSNLTPWGGALDARLSSRPVVLVVVIFRGSEVSGRQAIDVDLSAQAAHR